MRSDSRLAWIAETLAETGYSALIEPIKATPEGEVILLMKSGVEWNSADLGRILRAVESELKLRVDDSILIYLEPMQDRNRLRRLRGVRVV